MTRPPFFAKADRVRIDGAAAQLSDNESAAMLERLREKAPLSTARKRSIDLPIPLELVLSDGASGSCWIQLARSPEQLKVGTCMHLVDAFDRTATRRAPIEYRAVAGSGSEQRVLRAQGAAPRAASLVQLVAVYGCYCMPHELRKTIEARGGANIFSRLHHGLWAELEPTPRALGFIARRQIQSVVTDYVDNLDGFGSAIVGVSFA